jgi:thiol-disulfide isomerase/thioredoxin
MSARRVRVVAASLVALLAACTGGDGAGGERFRPLAVGEPVPGYAARTLGGDSARVGPESGAPLTLVNVWATWCVPCRKEFPELERIQQAYADRGLRVLAVSIDRGDEDDDVRRFVEEMGATFEIGRDPEGRIQDRFQTIGVPETYLVSADGRLLWRRVGELPANDPGLAKAIEQASDER